MDSFFSSRNQLDDQLAGMPPVLAEQFIEASVRRMVKVEGPLETAKRLQRLSDICSGAYVLPIEYWQSLGNKSKEAVEAPKPETSRGFCRRYLDLVFAIESRPSFLLGIAAGILMSIAIDLLVGA